MAVPPAAWGEQAAGRGRQGLIALAFAVFVVLAAPAKVDSRRPSGLAFPGGTYFVVWCSETHRNNDDPIVFPRQPGVSHSHTYVGNRATNAFSTPDSLRTNHGNSCSPDTDASAYWFPTLYARGQAVLPLVSIIYYVRTTRSVRPFPAGLRVIAGNSRAKRSQQPRVVSWTCRPPTADAPTFGYPPNCRTSQALHMNVNYPDCWDGRRVDSPNHASHMAYSSGGRCPSSHPVAVPMMRMLVLYPAVQGARVSSGRFAAHADFMNGWKQDAYAKLVSRLNY